jgi:hypothetical protein
VTATPSSWSNNIVGPARLEQVLDRHTKKKADPEGYLSLMAMDLISLWISLSIATKIASS